MTKQIKRIAFALAAAAVLAVPLFASAQVHSSGPGNSWNKPPPPPPPGRRAGVPEFDPSAIGVVVALIAGGGVLLARRKSGK